MLNMLARLNLIEVMMRQFRFKYSRMDGSTAVGKRDELITAYNKDSSLFAMLLTTRTGGVGISLTAAVIDFCRYYHVFTSGLESRDSDRSRLEPSNRLSSQRTELAYRANPRCHYLPPHLQGHYRREDLRASDFQNPA